MKSLAALALAFLAVAANGFAQNLTYEQRLACDRQERTFHALHLAGIAFAVSLGRRHAHPRFHPRGLHSQLLVQPVDDLPRALEIRDRLAPGRSVEHLPRRIAQDIVKRDNAAVIFFRHSKRSEESRAGDELQVDFSPPLREPSGSGPKGRARYP